jgi:Tol biopolymer transport system component
VYLPAGAGDAFRGDGWLLWVQAGTLVAQRLPGERLLVQVEPLRLADGVTSSSGAFAAAAGLLAYRTDTGTQRQLTWVDRSGTARGTVGDPDGSDLAHPRVSPDGRRVMVERVVQGNKDLWLLDGPRMSRLTFDPARDERGLFSPDGRRIVFRSDRTNSTDFYLKPTNGAGVEERFVASGQSKGPTSWSRDGRFLLFMSIDPKTGSDLWVAPMVGDHTPSVFLKTPFREAYGEFSPDGRWVAYQSDESGRMEVYLRPFVPRGAAGTPSGASSGERQVSTTGGIYATWRPDGKELYYLNPAGAMMAAPLTIVGATLEPGTPVVLFPTRIVGGGEDAQLGRQYDVAPDGRFLINTVLESAPVPITLVMNWNGAAKK